MKVTYIIFSRIITLKVAVIGVCMRTNLRFGPSGTGEGRANCRSVLIV